MSRRIQGWILVLLMVSGFASFLDAAGIQGNYQKLEVKQGMFAHGVSMLGREQNEYAGYLSRYAAALVHRQRGSQASLDSARQFLAVALHLSPQNQVARQVNQSLAAGKLPDVAKPYYGPRALSRLICLRAEILAGGEGQKDRQLVRYLWWAAHQIDPENQEVRRYYAADLKQNGILNWESLLGD